MNCAKTSSKITSSGLYLLIIVSVSSKISRALFFVKPGKDVQKSISPLSVPTQKAGFVFERSIAKIIPAVG